MVGNNKYCHLLWRSSLSLYRLQCSRKCCSLSDMTSYPSIDLCIHPSLHLSFTLCCSSVVTLLSCPSFVTFFLLCILSCQHLFRLSCQLSFSFLFLTFFPSLLSLLLSLFLSFISPLYHFRLCPLHSFVLYTVSFLLSHSFSF